MARGNRGGRGSGGRTAGQAIAPLSGASLYPSAAGTKGASAQSIGGVTQAEAEAREGHWIMPPNPVTLQAVAAGGAFTQPFGVWDFGGLAPAGVNLYRGIWQTPTFDLRADFKAMDGYRANAQMIDSRALIVGDDPHLFIEMDTTLLALAVANGTINTEIWLVEFGATMDPNRIVSLSRRNVTNAFVDNVMSTFGFPTDSGTPAGLYVAQRGIIRVSVPGTLRYWGAALIIEETTSAVPATPTVNISGALH